MASVALTWKPAGSWHHIGFVVASIGDTAPQMALLLGCEWDGTVILDPIQQSKVTFLRSLREGDPLFELVEPEGKDSPVGKFLQRGGGLHHVCYEVDDLEAQLQRSRSHGALVFRQPAPALAFGGRRIAWVFSKTKLLIEYLEASKQ